MHIARRPRRDAFTAGHDIRQHFLFLFIFSFVASLIRYTLTPFFWMWLWASKGYRGSSFFQTFDTDYANCLNEHVGGARTCRKECGGRLVEEKTTNCWPVAGFVPWLPLAALLYF